MQTLSINHPDFWRPETFCPLTKIRTKSGALKQFHLWDHQKILAAAVWRAYQEKKWLVHVKPRQEGSSTFFTTIATQHACFRSGCFVGILAHKKSAAQQLANIAIRAHKHLPDHIRPRKSAGLKRSLELPELDSTITIESVKSDEPLRGNTVQFLLATEISSWSDTAGPEAWASALSAVSDDGGFVIGESTPKYHGDELHQVCMDAESPDSKWIKVFIPWTLVAEYSTMPRPGWNPTRLVREYWDAHPGLLPEQAYWLQTTGLPKCRNDVVKFKSEYPINEIECWMLSGDAIYDSANLLERLQQIDGGTGVAVETNDYVEWEKPAKNMRYIIACDPAGSWAKKDKFGIEILNVDTCTQVAEYLGHTEAYQIAKKLVALGERYNMARIYVEANGVGEAVLSHLMAIGYKNIYFRSTSGRGGGRRQPGWYCNVKTKAQAEGYLQQLIQDGSITLRSVRGIRQLINYRGQWSKLSRDISGGHFDLASSLAIAAWAWRIECGAGYVARRRPPNPNEAFRRILRKIDGMSTSNQSSRWGDHI